MQSANAIIALSSFTSFWEHSAVIHIGVPALVQKPISRARLGAISPERRRNLTALLLLFSR